MWQICPKKKRKEGGKYFCGVVWTKKKNCWQRSRESPQVRRRCPVGMQDWGQDWLCVSHKSFCLYFLLRLCLSALTLLLPTFFFRNLLTINTVSQLTAQTSPFNTIYDSSVSHAAELHSQNTYPKHKNVLVVHRCIPYSYSTVAIVCERGSSDFKCAGCCDGLSPVDKLQRDHMESLTSTLILCGRRMTF